LPDLRHGTMYPMEYRISSAKGLAPIKSEFRGT
jgi:hypothetical protein